MTTSLPEDTNTIALSSPELSTNKENEIDTFTISQTTISRALKRIAQAQNDISSFNKLLYEHKPEDSQKDIIENENNSGTRAEIYELVDYLVSNAQADLEIIMGNSTEDPPYTANQLVAEARANRVEKGCIIALKKKFFSLPSTLTDVLEMALSDFDYQQEKSSELAASLRCFAAVIADLEIKIEEINESAGCCRRLTKRKHQVPDIRIPRQMLLDKIDRLSSNQMEIRRINAELFTADSTVDSEILEEKIEYRSKTYTRRDLHRYVNFLTKEIATEADAFLVLALNEELLTW